MFCEFDGSCEMVYGNMMDKSEPDTCMHPVNLLIAGMMYDDIAFVASN